MQTSSQATVFGHLPITPMSGDAHDHDELISLIGDRRLVFMGEASHGTAEFYRERIRLTQRLISECGFTAVAVEADWPDAYRVNRFVRGVSDDADATTALRDFRRFPSWMWRNVEVAGFVEWLRDFNQRQGSQATGAGFYGLDLYSLRTSMDAVISYLDRHDPRAAAVARHRYGCFDAVDAEGQMYGHAVALDVLAPCEGQVVAQLMDLRRSREERLAQDGWVARDAFFAAEQNARLVLDAERYYRGMYQGDVSSWNLRDLHMAHTLHDLVEHLSEDAPDPAGAKVVIWAHNSHVGDARHTQMGDRGEFTIGQLARQRYGENVFLLGFTTDHGWVTAASEWGGPTERKRVRSALPGSYERLFHDLGPEAFWMPLSRGLDPAFPRDALERAIGVIYRPETERASHWFHADLARQFDVVVHIDRTTALIPLETTSLWEMGEPPETYPTGI